MRPLGPQCDHYWLALSMAKAAGIDLQAAIDAGRFSHEQWAHTVQRCRSCEWGGDCAHWLQQHANTERVPDTCENSRVFTALRQAQEDAAPRVRAG